MAHAFFNYSPDNDHCVVYTSPPPAAEPLLKEKPFGGRTFLHTYIKSTFPLIRLAIRSTPSPVWAKAFMVVRYLRNLAVLLNYRSQPILLSASNHAPVAR